jgi:hypothetical protein
MSRTRKGSLLKFFYFQILDRKKTQNLTNYFSVLFIMNRQNESYYFEVNDLFACG